ncbi:type II secretion system F family protein [Dethiobacter alkaliphilus]|uniref:Type II secretion system protein n=1 Tax=Dethiobacter alkaliphilus AHT 1 TaxID=555088 RepID=C0GEA0_DETAL|nr:type II secretion system F family protein [Dethiobacter alkaliphilus]EEG78394.1 type II secretion system protein [Dethiobacter alkaliphilus AHT 1]
MQFIVLVGAFLTAVFLVYGLYGLLFSRRLAVLDRLEMQTMEPEEMWHADISKRQGLRQQSLQILGAMGKMFSRKSYLDSMHRKLIQAHILLRPDEFIGLVMVSGIGAALLFFLLTGSFLMAVLVAVIGFKAPGIYVDVAKGRRMQALNNQLPEALNIISSGLRAGYSFPQAMAVVGREMDAPIADEFNRVLRDNRLGKSMDDALLEMTARTDNEDLDLVVTSLLIQRQVGGNMAEVLNKIEHTIRERMRIKGEIRALTAQQRMSAVIIVLLPIAVALLLLVINPEYMLTLVTEPIGIMVLSIAVIMQIVGIMIIRRIVQIEV